MAKNTTKKIKEVKKEKPSKITNEELNQVQSIINEINRAQLEIGSFESKKHNLLHHVAQSQEKLGEMTTPEYVDSTPETQIVVTSYGEDVVNQEKKRPRVYQIQEEELIEIDKLSGREVKWLLPKGIKDALLDMEEGTKKILNLPPELAYGKSGASSFRAFFRYRVPPYSYMKIELELVKILNEDEIKSLKTAKKEKKRAEDMQVQDKDQNTPN